MGVADASFHGTIVSYDIEAFIPLMMGPDLGVTFGSDGDDAGGDLRRHGKPAVVFPHGHLRSGATIANATAAARRDLGGRSSDRPVTERRST